MLIHQGAIATVVPASAEEMPFDESGTIHIAGKSYRLSEIEQITFSRNAPTAHTVGIEYAESEARVTVSADIADYLTIKVNGGHVGILVSPDYLQEIQYVLSGTCSDGSFWMDGEFKAGITMNNLTLINPDSAAICIENGKRIDVIIPDGTTTTLTDGAGGTHDACFFINGHAEMKGGGTLRLTGLTKHAYASDEYTIVKPSFGLLEIESAEGDGLHINQYLRVDGGKLRIKGTKGDCIDVGVTKDPLDELNGEVFINNGSIDLIVAADDVKGIKSDGAMTVSGGTINALVSGLGTKGLSVGTNLLVNKASGIDPQITMTVSGTTFMPGDPLLESKCRGIKVKGDFTLDGGNIKMTVTGVKAKAISVDGEFTHNGGTTSHLPS